MRSALLRFANNRMARRIATGRLGRRVSLRFVAGEDVDEGLAVVKTLNARGMTASLDHLGENVTDAEASRAATADYLLAIERIEAAGLDANISVKLTQLGLDVERALAEDNARRIVERARAAGITVTIDMEDHRYTQRTVDMTLMLHEAYPGSIGVAVQAYLHRTPADLERCLGVQVRLCKGAYLEPPAIAIGSRRDVDSAFAHLARRLLRDGAYPMIATHDERLVQFVKRIAEALGRPRDTFEFQMLYGIRRDLQNRLVSEGYRVRVYVPYGTEWYPYLVRRLAERPANIRFFLSQLFRR